MTSHVFQHESLAFSGRLAKAGVSVECHLLPVLQHGWETLDPPLEQLDQVKVLRQRFWTRL